MKFRDVLSLGFRYLYAGDIPLRIEAFKSKLRIGLSLHKSDDRHIKHDITHKHDLPDNFVDVYQAEDVIEHIEKDKIVAVFNDIYRILKPGGLFRLSVPDYRCDVLINRSLKNENNEIVFDPGGGRGFCRWEGGKWRPSLVSQI